jgi:hypothetical protein
MKPNTLTDDQVRDLRAQRRGRYEAVIAMLAELRGQCQTLGQAGRSPLS